MIQVNIRKQDVITNGASFQTEEELQSWLVQEISNGSFGAPEDYTVEIIDISAQVAQDAVNAAALKLLAETDWLVIRSITEADCPVPQDILDARAAARASIVR